MVAFLYGSSLNWDPRWAVTVAQKKSIKHKQVQFTNTGDKSRNIHTPRQKHAIQQVGGSTQENQHSFEEYFPLF